MPEPWDTGIPWVSYALRGYDHPDNGLSACYREFWL